MNLTVLAPGLLTTVQDGGRIGAAAYGVGRAGALDPVALRLANVLVGNAGDAAVLEFLIGGARLRFDVDTLIAFTGADMPLACGGQVLPAWRPLAVAAGSELRIGHAARGLCSYLAVAGGIDVADVLGSRSIDVNAGIGPCGGHALSAGDTLPYRALPKRRWRTPADSDSHASVGCVAANWSLDPRPWFDTDPEHPIAVVRGSHFDCMDPPSQRRLFATAFRIDNDSNRVGCRLSGEPLTLREPIETVSEGVVPGTVQLPPAGQPIVLLAEAPTCGGYPRIAQVAAVDLPRLAQRRPGDTVRFSETSLEAAQTRYLERERALARLQRNIAARIRDG